MTKSDTAVPASTPCSDTTLQVFTLSRTVRTFGTEGREGARYSSWLKRLTHLSVRQAAAYLMYLTTNSGLYYLTKVLECRGLRSLLIDMGSEIGAGTAYSPAYLSLLAQEGAQLFLCRKSMYVSISIVDIVLCFPRRCARCWWAASSA